jgi:glycosyltransferase involved in cell wall biosynthesis
MISRQKIVLVTSRFPLPLVGGFEIKNYHLIKELSKHYEVSAHFIQRARPRNDDIQELSKYCKVKVHTTNLLHIAIKMIFNLAFGQPLVNALYFSPTADASIKMDLESADAAVCSVIRTCNYIEGFDGPKVFDFADSQGQMYKQNIPFSKGWRRLAYCVEAPRLLRKERQLVETSDGVLFFNQKEASLYCEASNVHVVPHGVSEGIYNSSDLEPQYADGLSFIGKLDVAHNVDMVLWFACHVLPQLPRNLKLYLIGSKPSPSLVSLAQTEPRVVILGFLDDPYIVLRSSIASICPLQTGGGIQNKIIESLACGAITIVSSKALSPFTQIGDSGILVCDTPTEWVRTINELIDMPLQHQFRRNKGRSYADARFSWLAYGEAVRNVLKNAIDIRDSK